MPQSIIVYRNPVEAAFWETLMTSEYTFPVGIAVVAFLAAVAIAMVVLDNISLWPKTSYRTMRAWHSYFAVLIGAFVAVATFLWMV